MTVKDVARRVEAIYEMRGDNEAAHKAIDALWADVLAYIATGPSRRRAATLALAALTTEQIQFARWYA